MTYSGHLQVKGCVRVLKEQPTSRSESLLNALRYTTKHLNVCLYYLSCSVSNNFTSFFKQIDFIVKCIFYYLG
jgi:hypothetical protein